MRNAVPTYDENRTDNIELLFHAITCLQLIPGCESQTQEIKNKLTQAFDEFPVQFDKTKKAYRESAPFIYRESGVVTASNLKDDPHVVLDAWEPQNRPAYHKRKPSTNRSKPSHIPILNINPIWYLQLMQYENRKATRHVKEWASQITPYVTYYHEAKIIQTLPVEEQEIMAPFDIRNRNQNVFRLSLGLFQLRTHTIKYPYPKGKAWNELQFFFLTDDELEQLSTASAKDAIACKKYKNEYGSNRNLAHIRIRYTKEILEEIIEHPRAERITIDLEKILTHTKESMPREGQTPYQFEIIDHMTSWEELHRRFLDLSESHLNILRELNLLDDQLLATLKTKVQEDLDLNT